MSKIFLLLLLLPLIGKTHPGIGIVKDSKGNIFYTDLKQVWKITNGKHNVVVPNVHTHELYIDSKDNLYGEDGYYDDKTEKFFHYLWMYKPNGQIDTVIGMSENYVYPDFSLAKDKIGNEYYLKRFFRPHNDTNHIYKKSPDGKETIFATGNFKNVNWLHPQDDGSLFFVSGNAIYSVSSFGNTTLIKEQVANQNPSYKFSGNNISIWSVWKDDNKNIYAAVFSDQSVKKIDTNGVMTEVYKSKDNWTPLSGVFDNENRLWVLEGSDQNEVRTVMAEGIKTTAQIQKKNSSLIIYIIVSIVIALILFSLLNYRKNHNREVNRTGQY